MLLIDHDGLGPSQQVGEKRVGVPSTWLIGGCVTPSVMHTGQDERELDVKPVRFKRASGDGKPHTTFQKKPEDSAKAHR